ncbi:MAG: cell wall hydrolase [Clostridia bacterium]|nr:cell wall hydrolase [Clostridia bacterium]
MYKKIIAVCLMLVMLLSVIPVQALDTYGGYPLPVDLEVNDSFIRCVQKPVLINNVAYIPLRAFADAIGATIIWDDAEKAATVVKDNHTLVFYLNKDYSLLDGAYGPGIAIHYGLMFVPARAICDALGYSVEWDGFYYVVDITAPGVTVPEACKDYSYNYDDLLYLGKITHVECGAEPFETRIGIANTVINRVRSPLYPNTIKGAIYDTKHGVQYPPAHTSHMNRTPSVSSMLAAKCALNGVELVGDSVAFVNVKYLSSSWAHNNMQHYVTLGIVAFYRFP